MPNWKNFSSNEVVNPFYDGCPANTWSELPPNISNRLQRTMKIIQDVRSWSEKPIRLTSTWRPRDYSGPHKGGFAIDFQFIGNERNRSLYKETMNFLSQLNIHNVRVFLEWQGNGMWIHIDRDYRGGNNTPKLMIGRPVRGRMVYHSYEGKTPMDY